MIDKKTEEQLLQLSDRNTNLNNLLNEAKAKINELEKNNNGEELVNLRNFISSINEFDTEMSLKTNDEERIVVLNNAKKFISDNKYLNPTIAKYLNFDETDKLNSLTLALSERQTEFEDLQKELANKSNVIAESKNKIIELQTEIDNLKTQIANQVKKSETEIKEIIKTLPNEIIVETKKYSTPDEIEVMLDELMDAITPQEIQLGFDKDYLINLAVQYVISDNYVINWDRLQGLDIKNEDILKNTYEEVLKRFKTHFNEFLFQNEEFLAQVIDNFNESLPISAKSVSKCLTKKQYVDFYQKYDDKLSYDKILFALSLDDELTHNEVYDAFDKQKFINEKVVSETLSSTFDKLMDYVLETYVKSFFYQTIYLVDTKEVKLKPLDILTTNYALDLNYLAVIIYFYNLVFQLQTQKNNLQYYLSINLFHHINPISSKQLCFVYDELIQKVNANDLMVFLDTFNKLIIPKSIFYNLWNYDDANLFNNFNLNSFKEQKRASKQSLNAELEFIADENLKSLNSDFMVLQDDVVLYNPITNTQITLIPYGTLLPVDTKTIVLPVNANGKFSFQIVYQNEMLFDFNLDLATLDYESNDKLLIELMVQVDKIKVNVKWFSDNILKQASEEISGFFRTDLIYQNEINYAKLLQNYHQYQFNILNQAVKQLITLPLKAKQILTDAKNKNDYLVINDAINSLLLGFSYNNILKANDGSLVPLDLKTMLVYNQLSDLNLMHSNLVKHSKYFTQTPIYDDWDLMYLTKDLNPYYALKIAKSYKRKMRWNRLWRSRFNFSKQKILTHSHLKNNKGKKNATKKL